MLLLVKGKRARTICRECKKLHEKRKCPRRNAAPLNSEEAIRAAALAEWRQRRRQA